MGEREAGDFTMFKSDWYSSELKCRSKKGAERRKKKTRTHEKKEEKEEAEEKIMHKIPATISCACAAFTAIFAPTALITESTI